MLYPTTPPKVDSANAHAVVPVPVHAHELIDKLVDEISVRNHRDETNYFPVRCFGKLAESVTNIEKGTKLFVAGELEISLQ